MKTLHYIDLGLHTEAREITMMQEACAGLPVELHVHGIEANPTYITALRERFAHQPNFHIHCYAITDKEAPVKLYLSESTKGQGSSIFRDKNNVTDNYVETQGMPLSALIDNGTIPLGDINVLKYNIEGAEYLLMKDLIGNQMQHVFQLFCGAKPDMHKVESLKHLESTYKTSTEAFGVHRFDFYHWPIQEDVQRMIQDMRNRIEQLL